MQNTQPLTNIPYSRRTHNKQTLSPNKQILHLGAKLQKAEKQSFDEFTKLPLIVNLFKYAVKTPQFAKEIAVFLPQFLYICSRKHQIRQEIWNF